MNLDCQHVREIMDSYLSEELSVETNHGVLRHVTDCRDCAAELKRRQRLRALLAETLEVAVDADCASAGTTPRSRSAIATTTDRTMTPSCHRLTYGPCDDRPDRADNGSSVGIRQGLQEGTRTPARWGGNREPTPRLTR